MHGGLSFAQPYKIGLGPSSVSKPFSESVLRTPFLHALACALIAIQIGSKLVLILLLCMAVAIAWTWDEHSYSSYVIGQVILVPFAYR